MYVLVLPPNAYNYPDRVFATSCVVDPTALMIGLEECSCEF